MQTFFTPDQLEDPGLARANEILRACVHCGMCTATCPTYQVLGDELDSPRGRIYLIKDMLESGRAADDRTVTHIDRCLSCLACMTTCPSGVHYMHLVDHARARNAQKRGGGWLRVTLTGEAASMTRACGFSSRMLSRTICTPWGLAESILLMTTTSARRRLASPG